MQLSKEEYARKGIFYNGCSVWIENPVIQDNFQFPSPSWQNFLFAPHNH